RRDGRRYRAESSWFPRAAEVEAASLEDDKRGTVQLQHGVRDRLEQLLRRGPRNPRTSRELLSERLLLLVELQALPGSLAVLLVEAQGLKRLPLVLDRLLEVTHGRIGRGQGIEIIRLLPTRPFASRFRQ